MYPNGEDAVLKTVARKGCGFESYTFRFATLAQLAEQSFCKAQVASSTLAGGFYFIRKDFK